MEKQLGIRLSDYKMKVLYANLLFGDHIFGHKNLDTNILKALKDISDVYLICPVGWYPFPDPKINQIQYSENKIYGKNRFTYYLTVVSNIYRAIRADRKNKFDYIIFASYDTILGCLLSFFKHSKTRVFVIQHENLDQISMSGKTRFFFNLYKNLINHFVFELFIKEYMAKELGVQENKIAVLPHPVNIVKKDRERRYDCVAISNSNNEELIQKLLEIQKTQRIFEKKKKKIIMRSRKIEYDDGYLKIFRGFIDESEYDEIIGNAKRLYLPYPDSFRQRVSGNLVDALSNHISVIGSDIPVFNFYAEKYPGICHVTNRIEDVIRMIIQGEDTGLQTDNEFNKFVEEHSLEAVKESLSNIIKGDFGNE